MYYVWGNYELYNFEWKVLLIFDLVLSFGCSFLFDSVYYFVVFYFKFFLVVLDCYEVSLLGVDNFYKYYD